MNSHPPRSRNLIGYIMFALTIWGGLLATGAYIYGGAQQGMKAALIFGCVLAFLGFWAILLRYRAAVQGDEPMPKEPPGKPPTFHGD